MLVLLHALSAAIVLPRTVPPRRLGARHLAQPPLLLAHRWRPHTASASSARTVGPRRCGAPVLSGASLNSAGGSQLQWRQPGDTNANAATDATAAAEEWPMIGGSSGYHRMAGRMGSVTPPPGAGSADSAAPMRFSTPLLWFIGLLTMALSAGAYFLPLPPLQLVDLATSAYLPTSALLAMRACFALVVGMSLRSSLADPEPVRFNLITYAGTRLPPRAANFRGLERLTTYTVQCWALQFLYFTVAAAASALQLAGGGTSTVPTAIARAVHILYQIVVQTSLLVTCVVTFVLLPTRMRRGDTDGARR